MDKKIVRGFVFFFFFLSFYSVLQKGGDVVVLVEAVNMVLTPVDVNVVMIPTGVVAVVIGMTPPAGVAAPPHTLAGGRVAETASHALG